jgi:hypothetical protein
MRPQVQTPVPLKNKKICPFLKSPKKRWEDKTDGEEKIKHTKDFFFKCWGWTQGLVHARQVFCQ